MPAGATPRSSPAAAATAPLVRWPVKTAEHIDLWLHAFAMLATDSAPMPLYRRGYRDSLTVLKNRREPAHRAGRQSARRWPGGSPVRLAYLQAQFLPLDMANWDVLKAFAELFLQYEGDPRRAPSRRAGRA